MRPALPFFSECQASLPADDVDVPDKAAIVDRAAEAQVGHAAVAERAIRRIRVVGIAAAGEFRARLTIQAAIEAGVLVDYITT